ncbi:MAG: hypothetical protein ABL900_07685 [Burkholderiaceae bacterium]
MNKPKQAPRAKRIWRVSAANPKGEWVDVAAPAERTPGKAAPEAAADRSWRSSTYDLLDGSDVKEDSDTVPAELLDEIVKPKPGTTEPTEE